MSDTAGHDELPHTVWAMRGALLERGWTADFIDERIGHLGRNPGAFCVDVPDDDPPAWDRDVMATYARMGLPKADA